MGAIARSAEPDDRSGWRRQQQVVVGAARGVGRAGGEEPLAGMGVQIRSGSARRIIG
jgi:hypothetical protein